MEAFEKFVGTQVKAVYEDGERVSVARGTLTRVFDDGFIEILSDDGQPILIRTTNILKIKGMSEKVPKKAGKGGTVMKAY